MNNIIIVTDWEKVENDDFYLSDDWEEEAEKDNLKKARQLQKEGHLFYAYEIDAKSYVLYNQMDANQILIDIDGNTIIDCEPTVIGNQHINKWEKEY
jgi:hypothetical protein